MVYVSIVDIYAGKAIGHFEDAGHGSAHAFTYATLCFFGGFPISFVLDKIAERAVYHGSKGTHSERELPSPGSSGSTEPEVSVIVDVNQRVGAPGKELDSSADCNNNSIPERGKRLVHMGLLAAMAMALHNMPEGLVTFVGYMDSITSGITTAIAIAVHNVPEGMVIASAVYFGTGRRWKAIMWTAIASISEPIGGLIGLAVVCGGQMTDTVFGILFGLVAGIMVYISLKELLPSARTFDPRDRVSTWCLMMGMLIMACSLIAIGFSQPEEEMLEEVVEATGLLEGSEAAVAADGA
ncbi:hypothetical protein GPECTOR_13g729 [Gonium pectorale]|uniref:ZIP protein n=1 Tax=Gonium pectorale TaxID=33097 RepID=A0A150GNE1_GONPE|nr:hypothetical protein GPECTOR_13g729 [Gonium pectorale]|eukprot:KXZ51242.1 hypothetical protein GPECTOR_13g729 [Gonium pectorale]